MSNLENLTKEEREAIAQILKEVYQNDTYEKMNNFLFDLDKMWVA